MKIVTGRRNTMISFCNSCLKQRMLVEKQDDFFFCCLFTATVVKQRSWSWAWLVLYISVIHSSKVYHGFCSTYYVRLNFCDKRYAWDIWRGAVRLPPLNYRRFQNAFEYILSHDQDPFGMNEKTSIKVTIW